MADTEQLLQAFRSRPQDAELACDLADAYAGEGQFKKAILLYQHALEHSPHLARACFGGGCVENSRQNFAAAHAWFLQALARKPQWLEARHNLARTQYELGQVSEAFALFTHCAETQQPGSEQSRAMAALIVPGVPEVDQAGILATRRAWVHHAMPPAPAPAKRTTKRRPLRVGYVSSFFHRDNWMKPVWGLIDHHDRDHLNVTLFSDSPLAHRPHIHTSGLSNHELAKLVQDCEIDILVDLNGYSNMRRLPLFAHRIAPVTIGWFNMYATTGMSSFDYLIGDNCVAPPAEDCFYSEKILRVPGSYLTFDVTYLVPEVADRDHTEKGIIFGALASPYKMTDQVIESWCKILAASPASRLLIKNKQMDHSSGQQHLLTRFAEHGISPERLLLEASEDHFDFLKAYGRIDIALDTFPYNGGTTTTEAIWQGVPVLTFFGDRWASRTSASILRAAGLADFVAADLDSHVNLAIQLANSSDTAPRLAHLRRTMRPMLQASSVCDTQSFARNMERLFENAIAGANTSHQ